MSSSLARSLATGGSESFCVWDTSGSPYGKLYSHCPCVEGALVSQSWSSDASCLASLPKDSGSLFMSYSVKGILRTSELQLSVGPLKAACFPKTSHMKSIWVSTGANVAQILLSSPKTPSKEYSLPGLSSGESVSRMALNVRDDAAVIASNRGRLKMVNLVSGFTSTLSPPDDYNINDLRYNNFRHELLGSVSDSGSVDFWDVHARKKIASFSQHTSPASGIAFSPLNETLVLSSGRDKKCFCYDAKEKKPISTLSTEYPLTCVDFKQDGFTLALGTSQGKVLIYDLRSYDFPLMNFEAHGTSVHSIKYATPEGGKRASFPRSSAAPLRDITSEMSPILTAKKEEDSSFKDDTLGSTSGFSPLRRDYTSSPLNFSSSVGPALLGGLSNNTSTESMFSPLREGPLSNNSTLNSIPGAHNILSTPLGLIKEENNSEIVSKTKDIQSIMAKTASIIKNDLKVAKAVSSNEDENKENAKKVDSSCPPSPAEDVDMRHILTAFPSCLSLVDPSSEVLKSPSSRVSGSFQQTYLANTVKTAVQDHTRELTSLIWSARYESIKMFYELSDKIEETVLEASPNVELQEENKRLRQEIETMKSYF